MGINLRTHVALIGCEYIDPSGVLSLAQSEIVDELLLIGAGCDLLADEISKMIADADRKLSCKVIAGTYADASKADIAVLAAGIENSAERTPKELLRLTKARVHDTVRALVDAGFKGVLLVITNPIDIMTHVAQRASGFAPQQVIGLGTADRCVGVSGDNSQTSTTWCSAECSNVRFLDNCDPACPAFANVLEKKRDVAWSEYGYAGNRITALATCAKQVCETILRDERTILPVSTLAGGEYGISGVYVTLPCLLGRSGVVKIVELPSTTNERERLHVYAAEIRNAEAELLCTVASNDRRVTPHQ